MTELKPCPFCGSNDIEYHPGMTTMGNEAGVVRCNCCYSQVPVMKYGKRVKEPFVEWNRRANECDREYIIGQLDKMVEESKQTAVVKSCSECGFEYGVETENSFPFEVTIGAVEPPNFCPNCGARVIEEEL